MGVTWQSTKFPGVRYYEHETRKHGIGPDKYFAIRAQIDGKRREEGLGWASEGWSASKAAGILAELKKAHTTGEGAQSLSEKRELLKEKRAKQKADEEAERLRNITFTAASQRYLEWARANKKDPTHDEARLRLHVLPALGKKKLYEIETAHIESLKLKAQEKGLAAATVKHVMQVAGAVFNHAIRLGLFNGANPIKTVRFPKFDNKRVAFFTQSQAETLLATLEGRDIDAHDIALMSFYAGLRFSEIARLHWENIDFTHGIIYIFDAKNTESRKAFITDSINTMLLRRRAGAAGHGLIFPTSVGKPYKDIPDVFKRAVEELGFNTHATDSRQKLCFHSCRHSFASWLAMQGTPILTIKELLGHKTLEMTMRYSHLCPDIKREAVELLERRTKARVVPIQTARNR